LSYRLSFRRLVEFSRLAMRKAFRTVWWLTLPWFLVFVVAVGIMIINADVLHASIQTLASLLFRNS